MVFVNGLVAKCDFGGLEGNVLSETQNHSQKMFFGLRPQMELDLGDSETPKPGNCRCKRFMVLLWFSLTVLLPNAILGAWEG